MNQKIRELVDQILPNEKEFHQGDPKEWGYFFTGEELEKFAELILQDIDRIVDELYHAMPLEQASVLLTLDENIKEHFYGLKK